MSNQATVSDMFRRALEMRAANPNASYEDVKSQIVSEFGGGAFPGAVLPTTLVALDPGALGADGLALRLRLGEPSIVARVAAGRVLLDPRALPEDAAPAIGRALAQALLA